MKNPPSHKSRVRSSLRKLWLYSPERREALAKARIERGVYCCSSCHAHIGRKELAVDHIEPVTPLTGFDSWDGLIERLFCSPEGLTVLCKPCHKVKTKAENASRKKHKKV